MMPGINPRQMQKAMKRMGINQQDIEAEEVIIRTSDKEFVIKEPSVVKVNMMGQESFQISGEVEERIRISEEDVNTVAEHTGKSKSEARTALEETDGDLAEAILKLQA